MECKIIFYDSIFKYLKGNCYYFQNLLQIYSGSEIFNKDYEDLNDKEKLEFMFIFHVYVNYIILNYYNFFDSIKSQKINIIFLKVQERIGDIILSYNKLEEELKLSLFMIKDNEVKLSDSQFKIYLIFL